MQRDHKNKISSRKSAAPVCSVAPADTRTKNLQVARVFFVAFRLATRLYNRLKDHRDSSD